MASLILPLLFLLLPSAVHAQNNSGIKIGSSLTAGDASASPWRSPSGDFAFGFLEVDNNLFLLSIWFNKLPDKTLVWYAKGNNPTPRGSKLVLSASDGLVLQNARGAEIWRSVLSSGTVAFGVMNDTGNFMLVDSNSKSLWESFRLPADTLLPAQEMLINDIVSSRRSKDSFSQGRFVFRLLEDGNAVLNTINLPTKFNYDAYYISGTRDPSSSFHSGYKVIFDETGYLYVLKRSGERFNITQPADSCPTNTHYYKATLQFDGVFTVSCHPKNPETTTDAKWTDVKSIPDNICLAVRANLGTGACGYNSICTLGNDQRPSCKCPPGYSLIDPNDRYGNCKPDIPQICEEKGVESSTNDLFVEELPNTHWPMLDYEMFYPFSPEECKSACLTDCLCVVSVYKDNRCWKKKLPLANGRVDGHERAISYLKLSKKTSATWNNSLLPAPRGKSNQHTLIIVIYVLSGSYIFTILMTVGFFFYNKKKSVGKLLLCETFRSGLRRFTYKELIEATKRFKEELGRGSCGIVYKGVIETGAVAVKILDRVFEDSDKEFRMEVNAIGQTHHKNLVRLFGYCDDGNNRILVYEFMSNGTLAKFLFGKVKLSWTLRTQIVYEIARGLLYLHEDCSVRIIHCDIKPQNILLDEDYNVKISDFGLAKLLKMDQSQTETGIRGTKGYVAPDWFRSAPVTPKVDVYSFGVLLLEIICCRRNVDMEVVEGGGGILVDWAYDCLQDGNLEELVEGDAEAIDDMRRLERFVMVAIWCVHEDPSQRPTMKKVMLMLEGLIQVSFPPSPCPFISTY